MSQRTLEAHYLPNWKLTQAHGLTGYNCGYTASRGVSTFAAHQQDLVWRLLGDVRIDAGTTMLDVGCGIGGPAGWIFERFGPRRLIGLEYCRPSVEAAEVRFAGQPRRPTFLQGDAHAMPLQSGSVDVIFNLESALHYPDKRRFLGECFRVLRPGGRLCLGDITTSHKLLFAPAMLLNKLPTQFNSNIRLWSVADYRSAFADVGFKLLRHDPVSAGVADSLADGLYEIKSRGWSATRGYRGRFFYLIMLEKLLRVGALSYDLFAAERP